MPWTFGPAFPGHPTSVEMSELRGFTSVQRAAAFRARMDSFFFKQVDSIATSQWVPFPLAVMTCIGIETIGACKYGDPRDGTNSHFKAFAEELDAGFAQKEKDPNGKTVKLSAFLYKGFRNSLAHGFYGKWVFITHDSAETSTFHFDRREGLLVLNVYWFYERFSVVANKYLDDLCRATDATVDPLCTFNKNFKENFSRWL